MTMTFIKKIKTKSGAYAIEVKGYRDEDGKVKHKYVRYLGKLDEKGNVIPSMRIENTDVETVKLHGPVQVLHRMAGDMGLEFILGDYSPEILTLVYSHILRPESLNNLKRVINWINTDEIGLELPVSRKRFESAMDSLEKRIQHIERNLYERICKQCDCSTLLYDVTGVYFYGKEVKQAKRGHGSNLPQIGIGLAVESQYGIPLFHMLFDGNVFDAKTFPVILGRLKEFKRETCTLIYDRGIASKKNVADAVANGFSVIACIPLRGNSLKQLALKEVKAMTPKDTCKLSSVFIHARELHREWGGIPVRLIVCMNTPLRHQIQQNRYYELEEAVEKLKRGADIKKGLKKYMKEVEGTPQIDYDVVEEHERFDGVYIVITTTDLPKVKVVQKYFERDIIEKSFQFLKSTLSVQPVRHWLWRRVKAHIFICYLAYLHLSWMKMLLEKNGISLGPVKALEQLETIYTVRLTDKKTHLSTTRTVPLTEEQEKIYRALNLLS
jgi:transposase